MDFIFIDILLLLFILSVIMVLWYRIEKNCFQLLTMKIIINDRYRGLIIGEISNNSKKKCQFVKHPVYSPRVIIKKSPSFPADNLTFIDFFYFLSSNLTKRLYSNWSISFVNLFCNSTRERAHLSRSKIIALTKIGWYPLFSRILSI